MGGCLVSESDLPICEVGGCCHSETGRPVTCTVYAGGWCSDWGSDGDGDEQWWQVPGGASHGPSLLSSLPPASTLTTLPFLYSLPCTCYSTLQKNKTSAQ